MNRFLLLCIGCALLTYSLAHLYRLIAIALQIVDTPNHRSAHQGLVPTGAGVSFVLVFLVGFFFVSKYEVLTGSNVALYSVLPALMVVAIIGFIDDYHPLSWKFRFTVHALCCAYIVWVTGVPGLNILGVEVDLGFGGMAMAVLGLIWLLNLYNFMDGIDGIATGEALCVLTFATAITLYFELGGVAHPVILLLACCAGFLIINWPRARAFMGDGGSGFLGLFFGVLAVTETMLPIWSWLILLGWFMTDTTLTITLRLFRGQKIHEAHSEHAYQHLNRAFGTTSTLLLVFVSNTVWLLPLSALAAISEDWGFGLVILAYMPLIIAQYYCGAGQPTPKLILGKQN
ncbi:MAG: glycosyltransferase family 4 protein [Gammaproteobacteria bacterium]|nr:glycosyltransferase family 4 protein [Gammaproteobacteria bacterium]